MHSLVLRVAAGVIVLIGAVAIPSLFFIIEGWRKTAVIPMTYICWKFAKYALRKQVSNKGE